MAADLVLVELPDLETYASMLTRFAGWNLFQTPEWLRFLEREHPGRTRVMALEHGGEVVGLLPGRQRSIGPARVLASPFPGWNTPHMGPVLRPDIAPEEFFGALERFLEGEGIPHCEVSSPDPRLSHREGWSREVGGSYVAPLYADPEKLLAGYTKSCRKTIRQAERKGVEVSFTEERAFIDLYYDQLRAVFGKRRMVPTYARSRVMALWEALKPSGRLLTAWAKVEGRVIATRIDMVGNGTLHAFGSASDLAMLSYSPNEILRHYVMVWAGGHGLTTYDLCGGGDYKHKFNASLHTTVRLIRSPLWLRTCRSVLRRFVRWKNGVSFLRKGEPPGEAADC
jgi:CelD/BcsL family acetyltransferase involved in cellulose biosynthesis